MDTNDVLLWSAAAFCLMLIGRWLVVPARETAGFVAVALLTLAHGGLAYVRWPDAAGFISTALCCLLLLAPLYGNRWAFRLAARRRFGPARLLAQAARVLHPFGDYRELPRYVDALERLARGTLDPAQTPAADSRLGRFVRVHALRQSGRWQELLDFTSALPAAVRKAEAGLSSLHLRALAELGQIERLLQEFAVLDRERALAGSRDLLRMLVAVRLGRVDLAQRLLTGQAARSMERDTVRYWHACALQAAGDARAEAELTALTTSANPDARRGAQLRLLAPFTPVAPADLSPEAQRILVELAHEVESSAGLALGTPSRRVTNLLLASLLLAFAAEIPGGSSNLDNLIELGALVIPALPGADEWWRFASAAWLHSGPAHLIANALGLWVLGPRIESVLGGLRMAIVYVGSALGGNLIASFVLAGPAALVGASGGVMGLLGALLAIAARRRFDRPTRFLRAQLTWVAIVVALQVAFDLSMPAVSSLAHIGGFASGFALCFVLVQRPPAKRESPAT
jgi:rhomboid protease GluP